MQSIKSWSLIWQQQKQQRGYYLAAALCINIDFEVLDLTFWRQRWEKNELIDIKLVLLSLLKLFLDKYSKQKRNRYCYKNIGSVFSLNEAVMTTNSTFYKPKQTSKQSWVGRSMSQEAILGQHKSIKTKWKFPIYIV